MDAPPADAPLTQALPVTPDGAPLTPRQKAIANLKRYPKGHRPPTLARGRGGPSLRTLESEVRKVLRERSYEATRQLARAIVSRAIKGEPAALAFLGPRLWPIIEDASRGARIVSQGVRLELPGGGSVSLVQSSGSEVAAPSSPLIDLPPQALTEGAHQPPMESAPSEEASTGGDPLPGASGGPLPGDGGDVVPRA